jgi:hypothetical protein
MKVNGVLFSFYYQHDNNICITVKRHVNVNHLHLNNDFCLHEIYMSYIQLLTLTQNINLHSENGIIEMLPFDTYRVNLHRF